MAKITGGVDTHLDLHVAAALTDIGGVLATQSFPTTPAGHRALLRWLRSFGEVDQVGVEGTGSYGAGLTRYLHRQGVVVVEVDRPNRQKRRREGKSDTLDAIRAGRAVITGEAATTPKTRNGHVESMRVLRVAKASANKARTQTLNQMRSLVSTAPDSIREPLRALTIAQMVRTCAVYRPAGTVDFVAITKRTLRQLARRVQALEAEMAEVDELLAELVERTAPQLVTKHGVGVETASMLLVSAGDNSVRLESEAKLARMWGSAPIPSGSGKTDENHRLHRGGDRQANSALWRIAMVRMATDPRTRAYVERRTKEGLSKRDILRCLKRYIVREVYRELHALRAA